MAAYCLSSFTGAWASSLDLVGLPLHDALMCESYLSQGLTSSVTLHAVTVRILQGPQSGLSRVEAVIMHERAGLGLYGYRYTGNAICTASPADA